LKGLSSFPNPVRTPSKSPLRGKVALITGASQGIGRAIALALAAEKCDLIVTARDVPRLKALQKELSRKKIRVLAMACYVSDPVSVGELFAAVKKRFRRLDILINNAGVGHAGLPVAELPVEAWREVIETNLTGTFLVTKAALPLMKRRSAIVNNLSVAAKKVFPGSSAYNASKHGALAFTNSLREELRERGIRVIALLPGATDTAIWEALWPEAPRKKMMSAATVAKALVSAISVPDDGTVEELTIRPSAGTL
jgi:NAD(P)-dependent dehydrogenase (short-subunit alcohol dehydrogenase family)